MIPELKYSLRSLAASKSRTFLTMLGIVIGVMSVLAVSSVGLSAQLLIIGQVSSLGSNLIGILPGGSQETGPPPLAFGIVTTTLTRDDVKAISEIPNVVAASSYVRSNESVSALGDSVSTNVNGVDETLPRVEDMSVAKGRFLNAGDIASFGRVAVLGDTVASELFANSEPVGRTVRIKGFTFEVIGVAAERGSAFFQDQDDQVYIPSTTAMRLIRGISYVTFARLKVDDPAHVAAVKADVSRTLGRRHHIADPAKYDFSVRSTDTAIGILGGITGALKAFLLAVTAVSLLVGGINIMNIMYVTVRERTSEIGLRKALGARRSRILTQFLAESGFISLVGGIVGVAFGIGLTAAVAFGATKFGYAWEFVVPVSAVAESLGISVAVGLIFGMAPAVTASRLEAIQALRRD